MELIGPNGSWPRAAGIAITVALVFSPSLAMAQDTPSISASLADNKIAIKGSHFPSGSSIKTSFTFTTEVVADSVAQPDGSFELQQPIPDGFSGKVHIAARARRLVSPPTKPTDTSALGPNAQTTSTAVVPPHSTQPDNPTTGTPQPSLPQNSNKPPAKSAYKLMPLGDSITEGTYRMYLYKDLTAAGINVDFVGSIHESWGPSIDDGGADQDHEGHPGWQTNQVADIARSVVGAYQPDVVTLHVGTNDLASGKSPADTQSGLVRCLQEIYAGKPDTYVVVSTIIPNTYHDLSAQIADYNNRVRQTVTEFKNNDKGIGLVDGGAAVSPNNLSDGIHPSPAGGKQLSDAFLPAVLTLMKP